MSHELSFSIGIDGKEILLPSIIDGVKNEEEAIKRYKSGKLKPLGVFNSPDEANAFAIHRSESYMPTGAEDFTTAGVGPALESKVPTSFLGKPQWPEGLTLTKAYKARKWADEQIAAGASAEVVSQAIFDANGWGLGNIDERLGDISASIEQGMSMNFADEARGAIDALKGGDYETTRDAARQEAAITKDINPVGSIISELLASLPAVIAGGAGAGVGKSVGSAMLRQGAAGGIEGATQAVGSTDADKLSREGLFDASIGAGVGAGLGGALGGGGYLLGEFGRKLGGSTPSMAADVLWRQGIDPASVAKRTRAGQDFNPDYLPIDVSEGMGDIGARSMAKSGREMGEAKAPVVERSYLKPAQEDVQKSMSGGESLMDIMEQRAASRGKFVNKDKTRITRQMREVLDTTEVSEIIGRFMKRRPEEADITPEILEGVREKLVEKVSKTKAGTVEGDDYRGMLDTLVSFSKSSDWKNLSKLDEIAKRMQKATDETGKMINPKLTPDEMKDKIIEATGLKDEAAIDILQKRLSTSRDMLRTRRKIESTSGEAIGAEGPTAGTGAAVMFGGWSWKEFSAARSILETMGVKSEKEIAKYLANLATTGDVSALERLPKMRKARSHGGSQIPGQGLLDILLPEIQETRRNSGAY